MAIDQKIREYTPKFTDIVSKAWSDEGFKARLVKDPKAVLIEQGIDLPPERRVRVFEPTPDSQLLLLPPNTDQGATMLEQMIARAEGPARPQAEQYAALIRRAWADPALKQRLAQDPAAVLREQGIQVPADRQVRVIELQPDEVPLVLPARPAEGELSDEQLDLVVGGLSTLDTFILGASAGFATSAAIIAAIL